MSVDIPINGTCVVKRRQDTSRLRRPRIIMEIRFMDTVSPERIAQIKSQLPRSTCADGADSSRLFVSLASEDDFSSIITFLNEM